MNRREDEDTGKRQKQENLGDGEGWCSVTKEKQGGMRQVVRQKDVNSTAILHRGCVEAF